MSNKDYNVYNTFDINFVNYGELYKTPREMEMDSSELIGDYADAMMKGPSDVYINSPELLGNRYFINTQTQCLDKNDNSKTHDRSVLVDNIHASAMTKAKHGNKGLIYSLLASMKSINSNTMFPMNDGEPVSFPKQSGTDYLNNVDQKSMPTCTNVSVYTDDKKDRDISGWVTEEDRENIDPLAIKEGMSASMPPMAISGDMTGEQFMEGAQKQKAVMDEHAKATADTANEEANNAKNSAQNAIKKSQEQAKNHAKSAGSQTQQMKTSNMAEQKKRSQAAKNRGSDVALKKATKKYLSDNSDTSIYDLLKTLMNTTYQCGKKGENYRRVPYLCIEAIWESHKIPNQDSSDARRNDLCSGEREKIDKPISPENFFNSYIETIKTNQNNTNNLNDLPSLPPKQICIMAPPKILGGIGLFGAVLKPVPTMIDGQDYKTIEGLLNNTYRYKVAETIVRYSDLYTYGQCKAVQDLENEGDGSTGECCSCEEFSNTFLECPKQNVGFSWLNMGAIFYMFILFLVFFFIVYQLISKSFSLNKIVKKVRFS
jgi:hypothetical protein